MNNTKISRRSFLAAAGIAGAAAALTACGSSASSAASSVAGSAAASSEAAGGSVELIVFAAASLTETLTAIGEIYSAENPGVTFSFNFDSSGTLKTQIQEGAACDLFLSAAQKQMDELDRLGLAYEVCPGVSSFCGAAAALKAEYTLPNVSQSVILTRMEGRTPVPEKEQIESFAAHGATMVIFLSAGQLARLSERLIAGGYAPDTPAAIVYKATWPDEKVVRTTVADLAEAGAREGITKTALITVGGFLGTEYERSRLYDPTFTTEFREASR